MKFGYLVELKGQAFADDQPHWIMAAPFGKYEHPVYGEVNIDATKAAEFAANVKNNVRGQELDIDYDHKTRTDEAAGWVKDAEVRNDGLYLAVQWTKSAAAKIKEKAYKYFSPEFYDEWKHPQTGTTHKNVLFGGALTNRPFLKGIAAINMSEVFDSAQKPEGVSMDPKKLRQLLKLSEDASDAEVAAALDKATAAPTDPPQDDPDKKDPPEGDKKDPPNDPAQLSEAQIKQLAESNPVVKLLMEQNAAIQKQLTEQGAALKLSEVNGQVVKLNETARGNKRLLPPAVSEELKKILLKAPKELSENVFDAFDHLAKTGFVQLGEKGQTVGDPNIKSAAQRFSEATDKLIKENGKMTYADAVSEVAREDPELFDEYRIESTVVEGGNRG